MNKNWSDEELAASVEAYDMMMHMEATSSPYSKRDIYRDLTQRFGRGERAFAYRMQNISAVLDELGKNWIPGLKPARNVGINVKPRIAALIRGVDSTIYIRKNANASYTNKLPAIRSWLIEIARNGHEGVTYSQVIKIFGLTRFDLRQAMSCLGRQAKKLNEPIIATLIVNKSTRKCSPALIKEFDIRDDKSERRRVYDFWTGSNGELIEIEVKADIEIRVARFVSVETRPDQAVFRRQVYLAFNGACVISGCNVVNVLDAAHKHGRNWRLGENNAEDGYLMRKDLHALYDSKLLLINEEGVVEIAHTVADHYGQFHGLRIALAKA